MNWGNSYETWIKFFEDLGYTVEVLKKPENKNGYYQVQLLATSSDGGMQVKLDFMGPEGSNETTPGTIYRITMTTD